MKRNIVIADHEAAILKAWQNSLDAKLKRLARRAWIVLAEQEGVLETELGKATSLTSAKVQKVVKDFREMGLVGLMEAPRSGRKRALSDRLKLMMKRFAQLSTETTGRTKATKIQGVLDVSRDTVWREARRSGTVLERKRQIEVRLGLKPDSGLDKLQAIFVSKDVCVAANRSKSFRGISQINVSTWINVPKAILVQDVVINDLIDGLKCTNDLKIKNTPVRKVEDLTQRFLLHLGELTKANPGQISLVAALDPSSRQSLKWLSGFRRHLLWAGVSGNLHSTAFFPKKEVSVNSWTMALGGNVFQSGGLGRTGGNQVLELATLSLSWDSSPFVWWKIAGDD